MLGYAYGGPCDMMNEEYDQLGQPRGSLTNFEVRVMAEKRVQSCVESLYMMFIVARSRKKLKLRQAYYPYMESAPREGLYVVRFRWIRRSQPT